MSLPEEYPRSDPAVSDYERLHNRLRQRAESGDAGVDFDRDLAALIIAHSGLPSVSTRGGQEVRPPNIEEVKNAFLAARDLVRKSNGGRTATDLLQVVPIRTVRPGPCCGDDFYTRGEAC